jgi:hypothetical protein
MSYIKKHYIDDYVVKSIITMSIKLVKQFIFVKTIDFYNVKN